MSRIIVAGSRECSDEDLIVDAIHDGLAELGLKMTTCVSGDARGVDKTAADWAKRNGINVVKFPAKWSDIKRQGAKIKERYNKWTKKMEKYDCLAGFVRNQAMAEYADALIAIDFGTSGTNDMIQQAKEAGIPVYQYKPQGLNEGDFEYTF